jgi:hypothetical protein
MYRHTNLAGDIEEENHFESKKLELFSKVSMTDFPAWLTAAGNQYSQIQDSQVLYTARDD